MCVTGAETRTVGLCVLEKEMQAHSDVTLCGPCVAVFTAHAHVCCVVLCRAVSCCR